ncbi:hypothetical protein HCZ87_08935 [Phaeobacter sp. HF9A]|nr:hypothetical protein [Phaeobacter sp. HF9A]
MTASLPGTVYVDQPGSGIFAVELRPDGTGAMLDKRGKHVLEMTSYGVRQLCLREGCVNLRIEDGRLALYQEGSDRFEGYLVYLAFGRFGAPLAPAPTKDAQETQAIAGAETPASEACADGALFYGSNDCKIATNEAISADIARVVSSATTPPDQERETPPELASPEVEYPRFGRSADLMIHKIGTGDNRGQTRVDFEGGSPRIGGRVLVPSFTPDSARIVAVSEALALIRFSGPSLPDGCAEAYRWLWVDASEHGLLSEPFGACTKAADVVVHYRGSRVVATVAAENGVSSSFEIFPYRSDDIDPLRISVTSGPSVDFEPVSEEDWKTIERREAKAQRAAEAEAAKAEARSREADRLAQRESDLAARRKPVKPTGQIDGGNAFDILSQEAVQSVIASSEHAEALRQILSETLAESVYLPPNSHVGDIYVGLACGPAGCGETLVGAIYNRRTQDVFGFINIDFTTVKFGTEEWLKADPSAQAVKDTFQEMMSAIPVE